MEHLLARWLSTLTVDIRPSMTSIHDNREGAQCGTSQDPAQGQQTITKKIHWCTVTGRTNSYCSARGSPHKITPSLEPGRLVKNSCQGGWFLAKIWIMHHHVPFRNAFLSTFAILVERKKIMGHHLGTSIIMSSGNSYMIDDPQEANF